MRTNALHAAMRTKTLRECYREVYRAPRRSMDELLTHNEKFHSDYAAWCEEVTPVDVFELRLHGYWFDFGGLLRDQDGQVVNPLVRN